ncbi:uncharacterized protein H6S33_012767 [Morchella sextelata]|uniref:uncharacterized protein n=1 Tax=Morchella sextelata TaxID=1174677 RepID=UPI001D04ED66|nr:uncharacterized protein H6S33_012767 [Morchella sextelata]KAH0609281.1 hypothetical protein H6S33_012767 [Morchella sextelata]
MKGRKMINVIHRKENIADSINNTPVAGTARPRHHIPRFSIGRAEKLHVRDAWEARDHFIHFFVGKRHGPYSGLSTIGSVIALNILRYRFGRHVVMGRVIWLYKIDNLVLRIGLFVSASVATLVHGRVDPELSRALFHKLAEILSIAMTVNIFAFIPKSHHLTTRKLKEPFLPTYFLPKQKNLEESGKTALKKVRTAQVVVASYISGLTFLSRCK